MQCFNRSDEFVVIFIFTDFKSLFQTETEAVECLVGKNCEIIPIGFSRYQRFHCIHYIEIFHYFLVFLLIFVFINVSFGLILFWFELFS